MTVPTRNCIYDIPFSVDTRLWHIVSVCRGIYIFLNSSPRPCRWNFKVNWQRVNTHVANIYFFFKKKIFNDTICIILYVFAFHTVTARLVFRRLIVSKKKIHPPPRLSPPLFCVLLRIKNTCWISIFEEIFFNTFVCVIFFSW